MIATTLLFLLSLLVACCHAQQTSTVCSDAAITVTALSVTCDSPGTFYYGSGGYRNSASCAAGDKGNAVVYFDINDGYGLEDVYVTMICTSVAERVDLYQGEELCNLGTLTSVNGTACPSTGAFKLESSFYFSDSDGYAGDDDSSISFTPTLVVGFASENDNQGGDYDLGGANTNKCAGGSQVTTLDSVTAATTPLGKFFSTFGIFFVTLALIGSFVFYMYRQRVTAELQQQQDALVEDASNAELLGKSGSIYSMS